MKKKITYIIILISALSFAQEMSETEVLELQKANNYISEANDLVQSDDFILAEKEYRKAISVKPTSVSGAYNLAHSYYEKENFEEAFFRNQEAAKNATDKVEKHKIYHNIGNILMKREKCKEALEAFKNALRNNPKDEETRYNFALAKECAKNEKEDPQEEDKDGENKKDKNKEKENEDKNEEEKEEEDKGNDKEDENDKGNEDKKEGEDKPEEDKGKPKDEKKDENKEGKDDKKKQPQQQPGQLSPQQIKNLLEAMNNQEQKVQEKINAKKVKGAKVQTDKDW